MSFAVEREGQPREIRRLAAPSREPARNLVRKHDKNCQSLILCGWLLVPGACWKQAMILSLHWKQTT